MLGEEPRAKVGVTIATRALAIGDAAGLVEASTRGGVYDSLLSAQWAAETNALAFDRSDCSSSTLAGARS